ncbi:hypothetical protein [Candidatus Solincola sp.]|jgi:vacuolar-type H+-ATPase subunit H|nr:V-type ATPase subunit subunit G family protein [Actinomycetota bacterium]MDI7252035.1 V-type ATPase subunit subunit G family protein [Actinomycetota bacterium]
MAGARQRSKEKARGGKRKPRQIAEQLEEKFVGSRTEVFSRISAKEAEIRAKVNAERTRAERLIEDAKGEAAAIKRKATLEELGQDTYQKIIAAAQEEVKAIEESTAREISAVERRGEENLSRAVEFIVEAVISPRASGTQQDRS